MCSGSGKDSAEIKARNKAREAQRIEEKETQRVTDDLNSVNTHKQAIAENQAKKGRASTLLTNPAKSNKIEDVKRKALLGYSS